MSNPSKNSFSSFRTLDVQGKKYHYYNTKLKGAERLPYSLKVLLENLLRHEDGVNVTADHIQGLLNRVPGIQKEIAYHPARVLVQDFTGVPAVVDLAAMRQAMVDIGQDPLKINPLTAVDLVIDHSVMVDYFGDESSFAKNVSLEFERNKERYAFLKWGQKAFNNFRVVPPGTGICHQVNLEYLAQVVWTQKADDGSLLAYPDTLVGTDSHTTMVNGLAVLGWGVGGIEAEAAMLGQPVSMLIPDVVGFKLTGKLRPGVTATDLVLTITQRLRAHGVVGKFVEFYGPGLNVLSLADRATIANMAPEYGATCGFFPVDQETINYLKLTGREAQTVALVEAYAKEQGMWRETDSLDPIFDETLELDMSSIEPCLAGPKRPQDRVPLGQVSQSFNTFLASVSNKNEDRVSVEGTNYSVGNGDVVLAAITSCTNTSNPSVMIGAGIVAQKALQRGLKIKPWVKTSLAPGSQVVTDYLVRSNLQESLNALGFNLVGYGCATCIGNSGPLPPPIAKAVEQKDLSVAAVLSGNRNFEGRINPHVKANYLASPPLVVAYAIAGTVRIDLSRDPLGYDKDGVPVYLRDIWPTDEEIQAILRKTVTPEIFSSRYRDVFAGGEEWKSIQVPTGTTYIWDKNSTYVKLPPYFHGFGMTPAALNPVAGARALAILGDSVTTDHISPAGSIKKDSPAGKYLLAAGVRLEDFNSYGARRGTHEVMVRGTFANIRLRNEMLTDVQGGMTRYIPSGEMMPIYDAAMRYAEEKVPLVIIAGKEYGTGSSRDWAAKGTMLLGVRAVIAESFERIHRSNLVGMGVLPLTFMPGTDRKTLQLDGTESFDIIGIEENLKPRQEMQCRIRRQDGSQQMITLLCRIDTVEEIDYFRHGGILSYVLRGLASNKA